MRPIKGVPSTRGLGVVEIAVDKSVGPLSQRKFVLGDFSVQLRVEFLELPQEWAISKRRMRAVVGTHVVIVVAPDVMRQFVTQHFPDLLVTPEPVVLVGANTELDRFSPVGVQAQQPWVFMWGEFRQQSHGEPVRIHHMEDCVIARQLSEQRTSRVGVWEVW